MAGTPPSPFSPPTERARGDAGLLNRRGAAGVGCHGVTAGGWRRWWERRRCPPRDGRAAPPCGRRQRPVALTATSAITTATATTAPCPCARPPCPPRHRCPFRPCARGAKRLPHPSALAPVGAGRAVWGAAPHRQRRRLRRQRPDVATPAAADGCVCGKHWGGASMLVGCDWLGGAPASIADSSHDRSWCRVTPPPRAALCEIWPSLRPSPILC